MHCLPVLNSRWVRLILLSVLAGLTVMVLPPQAHAVDWSSWNPMRLLQGDSGESVSEPTPAPPKALSPLSETEEAAPSTGDKWKFWTKSAKDPDAVQYNMLAPNQGVLIQTEKGDIAVELFPDQAPITVKNFLKLVERRFYDSPNMTFHRVVPGFVIQTGDPTGTGSGGSGETIPLEAKNKLSHNAKGVVAMARSADPNSASSQFYITLAPQTSLDGKYAIFGKVVGGMDVLPRIKKGDKLYGVKLVDLTTIPPDKKEEKKGVGSSLKGLFAGKS
jgi:cyclophilin family peptidyl-prolyl cis-trans isomerase